MIVPVRLAEEGVVLLDQRRLPHEEIYVTLQSPEQVAEAIARMVVRGAPAIGCAAAAGMALAARSARGADGKALQAALDRAAETLIAARPTAVNLAWAVEQIVDLADEALARELAIDDLVALLEQGAATIIENDIAANQAMGRHGSLLVPEGARVLVHCNAGALATAGFGTALGVIRAAVADGKKVSVIATETRPFLQGARLTAWELQRDQIPVTLITDSMAGALMQRGEIDLVLIGADRIAANGDVANKIGSYTLAVMARRHGVPFYVAAPLSTIDAATESGDAIPIEERSAEELLEIGGVRIAPQGVEARHIAFDVTPAALVTALVTEEGILRAPYDRAIASLLGLSVESAEEEAAPESGESEAAEPFSADRAESAEAESAEVEPRPDELAAAAGDED